MDELVEAKKVFDYEIKALEATKSSLDDTFLQIVDLIVKCTGKIVVTGMGKSGHIASKIAATLASLGSPSFCMHPAEAMHGDLGMISANDIVIAISYSGESEEIIKIIPNIKIIGAKLIGITGNEKSSLARASDLVQILPPFKEACVLGLAPTSSTTATLCYGDALAVVASEIYGFKKTDFGKFHPAGSLGKKVILHVSDLMSKGEDNPKVYKDALLMEAISVMSKKGLGVVSVVNVNDELIGIITDGDLRRLIEKHIDIYSVKVSEVMTVSPKNYLSDRLAVDALKYLKENKINNLPIVDDKKKLIGTITWQQIVRAGIII